MNSLGVHSEVGRLRQAIVHRPGRELSRLTPANVSELLFDDVLWAKRAREEHDAFADALRDKGVRVHSFGELLAETLEIPEARAYILARVCTRSRRSRPWSAPREASPRRRRPPPWPSIWSGGSSRPTFTPGGSTACAGPCCGATTSFWPRSPNHLFHPRSMSTGAARQSGIPSLPVCCRSDRAGGYDARLTMRDVIVLWVSARPARGCSRANSVSSLLTTGDTTASAPKRARISATEVRLGRWRASKKASL